MLSLELQILIAAAVVDFIIAASSGESFLRWVKHIGTCLAHAHTQGKSSSSSRRAWLQKPSSSAAAAAGSAAWAAAAAHAFTQKGSGSSSSMVCLHTRGARATAIATVAVATIPTWNLHSRIVAGGCRAGLRTQAAPAVGHVWTHNGRRQHQRQQHQQ